METMNTDLIEVRAVRLNKVSPGLMGPGGLYSSQIQSNLGNWADIWWDSGQRVLIVNMARGGGQRIITETAILDMEFATPIKTPTSAVARAKPMVKRPPGRPRKEIQDGAEA